jgi:hypothetical protein
LIQFEPTRWPLGNAGLDDEVEWVVRCEVTAWVEGRMADYALYTCHVGSLCRVVRSVL